MDDTSGPLERQHRLRRLLPSTQRALARNGVWTDTVIAALTDNELLALPYIGPVALQDIRQHFPKP